MDNPFAFLAQARPGGLYGLLRKLPLEDAAVALAGLPPGTGVQVMAYYPQEVQAELMPAMREARRLPPERAAQTAARIRDLLTKAKYARDGQDAGGDTPPPAAPSPVSAPNKSYAPAAAQRPPARPAAPPAEEASPAPAARPAPRRQEKPQPWVPRTASTSPINGPAVPGSAPPVAGDPFASPLARAGLLDLIGRAQEKFLPKTGFSKRRTPPAPPPAKKPGARPEPREGVARSVPVAARPRVIGPAKRPPAPAAPERAEPSAGARRMDGKAILAAILRESRPRVRHAVEDEDPSLYRELRGRMFVFDDLHLTEDRALAAVFTAAPAEEAALALRFASPVLRSRVLRAVSPGRARVLEEPSSARTGMDAVEQAQEKVLRVALQLQAAGRILIDPRDPDLAGQ